MADLTLSCTIDRTSLSLAALQINDHTTYRLGANTLGGQLSYNRVAATSPFFDGDVPLWKTLQPVEEPFEVYVYSTSDSGLISALQTLMTALKQFTYQMTFTIQSQVHTWNCDTSSVTVSYANVNWASRALKVNALVMRQPVAVAGPL